MRWPLSLVLLAGASLLRAENIQSLSPADVIGWMTPLRIDDGRLGVAWPQVGVVDAHVAEIFPAPGGLNAELDRSVTFLIQPRTAAGVEELAVSLHIKGGVDASLDRLKSALRTDVPLYYSIRSDGGLGLGGQFKALGNLSADGRRFEATRMKLNLDSASCLALYDVDSRKRTLEFKFKEERALKFDLSMSLERNVLLIHLATTDLNQGFDFAQKPGGEAEFTFDQGAEKRTFRAESLRELIQAHPAEVQVNLLRPLSECGVRLELSPDLPTVMAAATTGFSDPPPAVAQQADALIKAIELAASPEERARAVTDLAHFVPQAIYRIQTAARNEVDPNTKAALDAALAAHPGIARALPYVQARHLENDREYLLTLLEKVPLFKDAARARLTALVGRDFGEDPAAWRK